MRVRLKGVNRVSKSLADGRRVTYYYAWKGGPRLAGKPGTPDFIASYNAAVAERSCAPKDQMRSLLDQFEQSGEFITLAERTRKEYKNHIQEIEREFGDLPVAALADPASEAIF